MFLGHKGVRGKCVLPSRIWDPFTLVFGSSLAASFSISKQPLCARLHLDANEDSNAMSQNTLPRGNNDHQ